MDKRQDDRDAKKSLDEATENPWEANKTNEGEQPAELQIGPEDERENLSRFEPAPGSERSNPDPAQRSVEQPSDAKEKEKSSEP